MQRNAYSTTIRIGDEEHTRSFSKVTIAIDPLNSEFQSDGYHAWVANRVEGLSTEDPEIQDDLSSDEGILTKDGFVYYDEEDDEVVFEGSTQYHGAGETVKTRIPSEAVDLEWSCDIDEWRNRHRHKWTQYFDNDRYFIGPPTLELLSLPHEDEEEDTLVYTLKEFGRRHNDTDIHENMVSLSDRGAVCEDGSLGFWWHESTTIIRDADPSDLSIVESPYDTTGWDNHYSLPGMYEHISKGGPFLVYHDDEIEIVLG